MRSVRQTRRPLVALVALVAALVIGYGVRAASSDDPGSGSGSPSGSASASASAPGATSGATDGAGTVALSLLPAQVTQIVRLIQAGGPFPYPEHDGSVFRNDEHVLPSAPDGYYREYTVPTPGSDDRGARRLIVAQNGSYYYTADHYETFRRVLLSS